MIDVKTDTPGELAHTIHIGKHTIHADMPIADGGKGSGPGAHDLFDASLASCKALTAMWYAKKNKLALERIETHVERDDSQERAGQYVLKVKVELFGPLSDEDKNRIYAAIGKCPIHKLMTTSEVVVETAPL